MFGLLINWKRGSDELPLFYFTNVTYVVKSKLIALEHDILDYHTLVFKNLENNCPFGHRYVMVTVAPNWQSKIPEINDISEV